MLLFIGSSASSAGKFKAMIEQLYDALDELSKGAGSAVFKESGMVNRYKELTFGFFPFGTGNLSENGLGLSSCKIMVLGNDFGAENYLDGCVKNGGHESESNPTIKNLKLLHLDPVTTFYTNLHLGVRDSKSNIERTTGLKENYTALCYQYFLKQLAITQPKVVICLGNDVRRSLIEYNEAFNLWKPKSKSLKKLYESGHFDLNVIDSELGSRKFIVVPHPCDLRNFTPYHVGKVNALLR